MPAKRSAAVFFLVVSALVAAPRARAAPPGATPGLKVEIAGLPAGAPAQVVVTGPGDVRRAVAESTALPDLAPGTYTVTAAPVRVDGPFVDAVYEADAPVRAVVAPGKPAVARIAYRLRGGTGLLWMATEKTSIGFGNTELGAGGKPAGREVGDAGGNYVRGLAFAPNGDLWVSGGCSGTLARLEARQLGAAGAPKPAVVLTLPGRDLHCLDGVAMARNGWLWVADRQNSQVLGFAPAQLVRSGAVAPQVIIDAPEVQRPPMRNPCGLAFDARQNLWVSSSEGGNTVVMYTPAQLAASGRPDPAVVLSTNRGSISSPRGIAFDAHGNLWVANRDEPIVKFTPRQLQGSGSPKPAGAIPVEGVFQQLRILGVAFDEAGNLWVTNEVNPARLVMFRAADLEQPARAVPALTIDGGFRYPAHLAASPTPRDLPLAPPEEASSPAAGAGAPAVSR